ncbi:MAG: hypothetical protein LBS19_12765 [Clostridiales bacterium]|jgi:hypothetical protein|nr:hypothetical protein [Clostridiales bacterium]
MKRLIKSFAFWMGFLAVLFVLGRAFIYTTSQAQNVLTFANFPLAAVLHTFFPDVLNPIPDGGAGSYTFAYLPYYVLFVLTYIGYGLTADYIIRKLKRHREKAAI